MNRLWTPWRSKYIESFSDKDDGSPKKCIFCDKVSGTDDEKNLVIHRGTHSLIMLNLYPYNSGHLMVVPFSHKSEFGELTADENADVMKETQLAMKLLLVTSHPDGFNFGANFGRVSGAGIADHVHFHIVPRWNGDTNFMPVLGETKIISEDLTDTYRKLTAALRTAKV